MSHRIDLLLERWCAGECSPEEAATVQRWIDADAANARLAAVMRAAWVRAGTERERPPRPAAAAWSSLAPKLRLPPRRVLQLLPARSRVGARIRVAKGIAAALLLGTGVLTAWLALRGSEPGVPGMSLQQVATAAGQRSVITLNDGTRVLVGVASRVRFAPTFGRTRDVYLDGEAFFEVAHDATRPFIVHTTRGTARALGTKFDVDAYNDLPDMRVVVTEGAVALKAATVTDDSLVLRKADLGRLRADGVLVRTPGADVARALAWVRGELVFDRTPVPEAVRRLTRWYGVETELGDSALARHAVTISLSGQPVEDAVHAVAAVLNARVERRGAGYLLLSRR